MTNDIGNFSTTELLRQMSGYGIGMKDVGDALSKMDGADGVNDGKMAQSIFNKASCVIDSAKKSHNSSGIINAIVNYANNLAVIKPENATGSSDTQSVRSSSTIFSAKGDEKIDNVLKNLDKNAVAELTQMGVSDVEPFNGGVRIKYKNENGEEQFIQCSREILDNPATFTKEVAKYKNSEQINILDKRNYGSSKNASIKETVSNLAEAIPTPQAAHHAGYINFNHDITTVVTVGKGNDAYSLLVSDTELRGNSKTMVEGLSGGGQYSPTGAEYVLSPVKVPIATASDTEATPIATDGEQLQEVVVSASRPTKMAYQVFTVQNGGKLTPAEGKEYFVNGQFVSAADIQQTLYPGKKV